MIKEECGAVDQCPCQILSTDEAWILGDLFDPSDFLLELAVGGALFAKESLDFLGLLIGTLLAGDSCDRQDVLRRTVEPYRSATSYRRYETGQVDVSCLCIFEPARS